MPEPKTRVCSQCGRRHASKYFPWRRGPGGRRYRHRWCAGCIAEYQRDYRSENRRELTAKKRARLLDLRAEGIERLGGKCACCGEKERAFLTLEHKNGSRVDKTTGLRAWGRVATDNFDPKKYELLCFNCNCALGAFGECPHERSRPRRR